MTEEYLAVSYRPCPACTDRKSGPLYRTSARLRQNRADRARQHDGADPVSGCTLEDAERHLSASTGQQDKTIKTPGKQ